MINSTIAASVLMYDPVTSLRVSLGLENLMSLDTAFMFYNYIALGIIFFIASMAGARNEARYCVFIPLIAGFFAYIGWLHSPSPVATWGVMVMCGLLGVMIYLNEAHHERYGVGGPGPKLINIVLYIVLFQAAFGMVTALGIFDLNSGAPATNVCAVGGQNIQATCDSYGNINLEQSVQGVSNSGGLLNQIVSVATALGGMALSLIFFIVTMAATIVGAPLVINSTMNNLFPGIGENAAYLAFMGIVAIVFWAADVIFVYNTIAKPFPSEGAI